VLILLVTQVFLEVIILPLERKIPRISSSSSHKEISSSSKRKSVVKESMVVKHTKQMALPNLLMMTMMGIKRFDHRTKVKARSKRQNLQAASQLCTKQVGTVKINQIIESLLKVKVQRITKTYQIET